MSEHGLEKVVLQDSSIFVCWAYVTAASMLLCEIQSIRLQSTLLLRDVSPEGPVFAVPLQVLMVMTAVPTVAHSCDRCQFTWSKVSGLVL